MSNDYGRSFSTLLTTAAIVATLALVGGCVAGDHHSTSSSYPSTTQQSTSPPAPIPGYEGPPSSSPVHSKVMNVTLPAGTTTVGVDAGTIPGIEIWHVPLDPAAAVDYIRPQLPTGPYEGLPACPVDVTRPADGSPVTTSWYWADRTGDNVQIVVTGFYLPNVRVPGPGSEVTITRRRNSIPDPC